MTSRRRIRLAGYSLVLIGIAVNKWSLSPLASDEEVSSWNGVLLLCLFQLPAILAGSIVVLRAGGRTIPRWFDLALLATSVAFLLAVAEALLGRFATSPELRPAPRAFVGDFDNRHSRHFVADPATGWRMRPNTEFRWRIDDQWNDYRSNGQGFRSDVDFDRIESPKRIVVAGDSFAFGVGVDVEDTFAALLEEHLGDGIAVLNLAMPGFGVDQMWMSVRHQAPALRPSFIIVAFIDDDLDRSQTAYRAREGFNKPTFELDGGTLRPQDPGDRPGPVACLLERHSALWAAVRSSVRAIGFSIPIGDWWSRNEAIFRAIIEDCRSSGVPVLFVRLPSRNWREFPNLRRLVDREGADVLDLGGPGARPGYEVHFPNDGHMNRAGHAFVAEKLSLRVGERLSAAVTGASPAASAPRRR